MLRHFDKSMVTNPRFQRFALELGRELGIPVQESAVPAAAQTVVQSICPMVVFRSSSSVFQFVTSILTMDSHAWLTTTTA